MISFLNVKKSYPEFDMAIDMEIQQGELVSILGPSGSGKTTTLRLIAGFEHPDSGTIAIDNRDVTGLSPAERHIGYVFQDYTLFPHMNVSENVAYGLTVRRRPTAEITAKVAELLELVDLPGYQERNVMTLSGGERQRVAIARALAVDPILLLLDEPFSSIDEVLRRDLRDEIVRLQQRLGITVVFVTHSRQEALAISDRVAVLNNGEIVQFAPVEELYHRPRDRFVANFVGEANFIGSDSGAAMLRPEQLAIVDGVQPDGTAIEASSDRSGESWDAILSAVVSTHQFLGFSYRYGCESEEGPIIVMDSRKIPEGSTVRVGYRNAALYTLREETKR